MLKLFGALKKDRLISNAISDVEKMLEMSERMFTAVSDHLLKGHLMDFDLYRMDQNLNQMEINVRRQLLEHGARHPKFNIPTTLTLTTIIVDIERIGDYCKNIYELHEIFPDLTHRPDYQTKVTNIETLLREMFINTKVAFSAEDLEKAQKVIDSCKKVRVICAEIYKTAGGNQSLGVKDVVAMVLYARFSKKVGAHLAAIATSVTNPMDTIGYLPADGCR